MGLQVQIDKSAGTSEPGNLLVLPLGRNWGKSGLQGIDPLWQEVAVRLKDAPEVAREGLLLPGPNRTWMLVISSWGESASETIRVTSRILEVAGQVRARQAVCMVPAARADLVARIAVAFRLSGYRHQTYKSLPVPSVLEGVRLISPLTRADAQAVLLQVSALMDGVDLCRDLVNTPSMDLAPEDLARAAGEMAAAEGLGCHCWHTEDLKAHGCEGILSVGRGSHKPPVLIRLDYRPIGTASPRRGSGPHLALVGKGVAFDTGGISIKPAADMWRMKGDMAGAGAVLGAMLAIARLRPAMPVTAFIPSALNAVDSNSVVPGDIIRARNGKTVHVDNTDAEGRLILMDALYEAHLAGATHCVDIATLTGACSRALGPALSGLFATDDGLAADILRAGELHNEPYWRLPLVDEYLPMLKNDTADLNNIGNSGTAGAITAALFLREFVHPGMKWAHLDIAGTGLPSKPRTGMPTGASGVGVRSLTELALGLAAGGQKKAS